MIKKILLLTAILMIATQALAFTEGNRSESYVNLNCLIPNYNVKSDTEVLFYSEHGVTIKNETDQNKTYHVEFKNGFVFETGFFGKIVEKSFDITLAPSQIYTISNEKISKQVKFYTSGEVDIGAITSVKLGDKEIGSCKKKGKLNVRE